MGWKIRLDDHRLASRGLPIDAKRLSQGTDFLSHSHTDYGFVFLLSIQCRIFGVKNGLPDIPLYTEGDITWWHHSDLLCKNPDNSKGLFIIVTPIVGVCN